MQLKKKKNPAVAFRNAVSKACVAYICDVFGEDAMDAVEGVERTTITFQRQAGRHPHIKFRTTGPRTIEFGANIY